jgi:DNA-binding response OmpR family regulator
MKVPDPGFFTFGRYRLDIQKRRLSCSSVEVPLARSEYLLLRTLALHHGQVVSRRQLMQAVWGTATMSHGALDELVDNLRRKLAAAPAGFISSASAEGYSLTTGPAPQHGGGRRSPL